MKFLEGYENFGDNKFVHFKSSTVLNLKKKNFKEWIPISYYEDKDESKFLNDWAVELKKLFKLKSLNSVRRYGLDTSSKDDTGIIFQIKKKNYKVIDRGQIKMLIDNEPLKFNWELLEVDTFLPVYKFKNEIANKGEDDEIYDGYYIIISKDFFKK